MNVQLVHGVIMVNVSMVQEVSDASAILGFNLPLMELSVLVSV